MNEAKSSNAAWQADARRSREIGERTTAEDAFPDTIINVLQGTEGLCAELPVAPAVENPQMLRKLHDTPERFKIRLANSEGRRSAASYLIHKRYSWRGYMPADGAQTNSAAERPHGVTLVASDDDMALATISVSFDSSDGLLVDALYGDEVDRLRQNGARLCEFTKLAVETGERSREVLAMIFHIAYMYARRLHDSTDLLIEVNPRHVRFYRAALGFEVCGPERTCPRVNAPAVLLRLDLAHCERQIGLFGGHRELADKMRSLYPLAFSPEEEAGICGRLRQLG